MSVLRSSCLRVLPLLVLALGCAKEKEERPPYAPGCQSDCGNGSGNGIGGTNAGGAGGADGEDEEAINVVGSVVLFSDDAFDDTATFVQQARVRVQEPDKEGSYLGANYDGTEFTVAGALKSSRAWVYVEMTSAQTDYWSTLTRQDTRNGTIEAPVVARTSLLEVFDSQSPKTPATSAAQLVVRVVDESGKGIEGVTVTVPGADFVTYRDLGVWSGLPESTTEEGLAFAGNIPAGVFPGNVPEVSLEGTVTRLVTPVLAAGAVTVVTVVVNP